MSGLQRLFIDGKFIGYVKRYFQDFTRRSCVFVLTTIDTESDKYQMQVEVNFENIKFINCSDSLVITTSDDQADTCNESGMSAASCEYRTEEGYCRKIRGTALPFLPYCKYKDEIDK